MKIPSRFSRLAGAILTGILIDAAPVPAPASAGGPGGVMPPFLPAGENTASLRATWRAIWPAPLPRSSPAPSLRTASAGNVHLLVILAEFADKPHRLEPARFDELLLGAAPSVRDYYAEVSRGALVLSGDLHGWVALPGTQLSYSNGMGGVGAYPHNGQKMAEDAVTAAIAAGLDLGNYDADGDGAVDALIVIHSGQGLEWAGNAAITPEPDPQAVQSHMWSPRVQSFSTGLPEVRTYMTCPELQLVRPSLVLGADSLATIGVYCHEFGHMMGLPDFYDTGTFDNRVGVWAIMDYGSWNRRPVSDGIWGDLPAHPSAWSKMFLGWLTPTVLTAPADEVIEELVALSSTSTDGVPLQLRANPGGVDWTLGQSGSGEYFLAEVRSRDGYDAGLPADGLLLYHVDEAREDNDVADNPDGGGLVLLLPQDGGVSVASDSSTTDPWPGSQTIFDATSSPSSRLFDGSESGVALSGITTLGAQGISLTVRITSTSGRFYAYARPNPWSHSLHVEVELVLAGPGEKIAHGGQVRIYDVAGRLVRSLAEPHFRDGRVATWDGRTAAGRLAVPGVYFFRLTGGAGATGPGRVLVLE